MQQKLARFVWNFRDTINSKSARKGTFDTDVQNITNVMNVLNAALKL